MNLFKKKVITVDEVLTDIEVKKLYSDIKKQLPDIDRMAIIFTHGNYDQIKTAGFDEASLNLVLDKMKYRLVRNQ